MKNQIKRKSQTEEKGNGGSNGGEKEDAIIGKERRRIWGHTAKITKDKAGTQKKTREKERVMN